MQMSTNDNSISTRFCWQTRIRSRRDFHTFCYTDGLFKKKVCLSIYFSAEKIFSTIFDFHFRENPCFRDEFQALTHAYTHTHTHTHKHTHIHPHTPTHRASPPLYTHAYTQTHTHTNTHTHIHPHTPTPTHTHTEHHLLSTHMHTHTHTQTHTHTNTYTEGITSLAYPSAQPHVSTLTS